MCCDPRTTSYTGYLVSTIQGSTDTTFYIIAVYFGAVGIRRIRHALLVGLTADAAGVAGPGVICPHLYGGWAAHRPRRDRWLL